jgi:hypothetical protein
LERVTKIGPQGVVNLNSVFAQIIGGFRTLVHDNEGVTIVWESRARPVPHQVAMERIFHNVSRAWMRLMPFMVV